MKENPVGWFEIYVQDMERARTFYEDVLYTKLEKLNSPGIEMWAFPMSRERSGTSGSLVRMPGFPSGGNSTLVYFSCADCATERVRPNQGSRASHLSMSRMPPGERRAPLQSGRLRSHPTS